MNLILHGREAAEIGRDNTLTAPQFTDGPGRLKRFDFAVANPPFSDKAWTNGLNPAHNEYRRFDHGEPPAKNGDYAYLLHLVASLRSTGKGAIVMPHGVLFRGNSEAAIRRNLVKRGWIKGVIGLPANLFYGTGIPACIVVIDKEHALGRDGIFMIDASKDFQKDGAKNRLRERDIHRIVDVFNERREIPGYARMVPLAEIAGETNDYNLNIPRYIDAIGPIRSRRSFLRMARPRPAEDEGFRRIVAGFRRQSISATALRISGSQSTPETCIPVESDVQV